MNESGVSREKKSYNSFFMITAPQTTTAYFSNLLPKKCPALYQSLDTILREKKVEHHLLSNTRDIWSRDYMPIQTDEKRFVFYKYNPNYLQKPHLKRTITDVTQIGAVECLRQSEVVNLDLVVDGGNVVKCGDKIVMTEKVFFENRDSKRLFCAISFSCHGMMLKYSVTAMALSTMREATVC